VSADFPMTRKYMLSVPDVLAANIQIVYKYQLGQPTQKENGSLPKMQKS